MIFTVDNLEENPDVAQRGVWWRQGAEDLGSRVLGIGLKSVYWPLFRSAATKVRIAIMIANFLRIGGKLRRNTESWETFFGNFLLQVL